MPHAGAMCLLDEVVAWEPERILCRSVLNTLEAHPLADRGVLPLTALVEYAAQATAAHGTLLARDSAGGAGSPTPGRLVGLRDIEFPADESTLAAPTTLDVHVERLMADAGGSIYAFRVVETGRDLVRGRVMIRTVTDEIV
ncbi:hypothetical protein [Salinisphaera hydrothermalis]|uniref:hypothetical protein n=1 Tax=Salinisphaera hydrothermalis TaxID=563188 RepID=UPI001E31D10A|nr:hypothetical protein [Salinisphaera hydrothermalis]